MEKMRMEEKRLPMLHDIILSVSFIEIFFKGFSKVHWIEKILM